MNIRKEKSRSAVLRNQAESHVLISVIAFGVTVIAVRVFLQLTGFPQIGNSVLHIAHALWGGLLLFVAVLLPLLLVNPAGQCATEWDWGRALHGRGGQIYHPGQ